MLCWGCNLGVSMLLGGNLVGATLKYGRVAQPQRSVEPMKRSLMFTLPRLRANLEPPWTGLIPQATQDFFIRVNVLGNSLRLRVCFGLNLSCVCVEMDNDGDVECPRGRETGGMGGRQKL